MLTATQFWTKERREELRKWNEHPAVSWRPAKLRRFKDGDNSGGAPIEEGPHKGFRFHERWPEGLRVMESHRKGDADARRCLDHGGWFTDSFQDGMIYACAVEVRIPRRRAKFENVQEGEYGVWQKSMTRVRWMEATSHTEWDQILIGRRSADLHDTLADCIRSADRVAELAAEEAREEDQKYQAEQQIEEKREEIKSVRAQLLEALAARREASAPDALCRVFRSWVADRLAEIRKARKRIALLEREPWQAVSW